MTIIQEAILEIKVFLVIFAAGLLGFAIAILHLMHGKYPMGNYDPNVDDVGTKYPYNFLGAVSATYFFMVRSDGVWPNCFHQTSFFFYRNVLNANQL